jgi:aromatic aminotransferase
MPNLRLAMQLRALNVLAMATKQSFHNATGPPPRAPQTSSRINLTADPCIVFTKALMSSTEDTLSLAQGIVHWAPPAAAIARATAMATDPAVSSYGPDEGSPALREALRKKLTVENGLKGYDVHITAGANQAFMNVVLALLDPGDKAVLFTPYYFNHHMALTMGCGVDSVLLGPCNAAFRPDLNWLELQLTQTRSPPKMVVLTNPCNPTGVLLTREELERAAAMTAAAGAWLIVDDTYGRLWLQCALNLHAPCMCCMMAAVLHINFLFTNI